jgi:hypothetical protein
MTTYTPKAKMATLKTAAAMFGISQYYIRQLALTKKIIAHRVGNSKIIVDLVSLDNFLLESDVSDDFGDDYVV